jgi:hypothetical protein
MTCELRPMPGGSACRMSSARRWEPVEARPILCQAHLGPEGQVWANTHCTALDGPATVRISNVI